MQFLGDYAEDSTVYIPFNTFDSNDPSGSVTITNFVNTDIHIHKGGMGSTQTMSTTQRNNAAGITVNTNFDGITGQHLVTIDTSDNTVAGFFVTGTAYVVRMEGTTIDGATVNAWIGLFFIEQPGGVHEIFSRLGVAGAGLTAIPWNSAWDAEAQSEVNDALVALGLDHLVSTSVAGADIANDSIVAQLVSASGTADWDDFDNTTDSLQAVRDRGDAAWTTGAGGVPPQLLQSTTIASITTPDTVFTLTAGSADDNAYDGAMAIITDQSTSTQKSVRLVTAYVGSTKTVTIDSNPDFTIATGDTIEIVAAHAYVAGVEGTNGKADILDAVWVIGDISEETGSSAGGTLNAILADTQTDGVALSAAAINAVADQVWDEPTSGHTTSGTFGEQVKTDIDAILGDTNELQTDWVNGGRLDVLIDAIKAKTDDLTFTLANHLDVNVLAISGDTTAADNLEASLETMLVGTVSGSGSTASTVDTALTGHGDDTFIGRVLIFRTGSLQYEAGVITDYDSTTGTFTFAASTFTAGAGSGDAFVIV